MSTRLIAVATAAMDATSLARFWSRALDRPATDDGRGGAVVRPGRTDGVALWFEPSARPKSAKNRMHLDLPGGPGEVRRLLALGAARADIGQGDVPWEVLADPEGNEFCVLPDAVADDRPAQICLDAADPGVQGPFWSAATGWEPFDESPLAVRMRASSGTGPALVMGPPAAPKHAPNRLQPVLAASPGDAASVGAFTDPEGNEYRVVEDG
jgi:hypothetical protein